jgi:hypothetical protein
VSLRRYQPRYGPNRLREFRAKWDPHNFFRLNANILPQRREAIGCLITSAFVQLRSINSVIS